MKEVIMLRTFTVISVAAVLASSIGIAQNTSSPRLKAHCPDMQWEEVAAEGSTRVLFYLCIPVTPENQKELDAQGGDAMGLSKRVAQLMCKNKGYEAGAITFAFQPGFDQLPLRKKVPTVMGSEADGTLYFPSVVECLNSLNKP
jgi:hypothetical protein